VNLLQKLIKEELQAHKSIRQYLNMAKSHPSVEKAAPMRGPDVGIIIDDGAYLIKLYEYEDGTWWWQKGYGHTVEDEDETGVPFEQALQDSLSE
jgi:hypothetical protein